jgi:DNA-binding NarL/FixJ family response regulator
MSEPAASTTVLVVDDQPLIREGNTLLLDSADGIEVVGEAGTGEQAVRLVEELNPHIVLMDVRMPGIGGIEATRRITGRPQASRVIVLTTFDLDEYAFGALSAGASAFLLKTATPENLVNAVKTVARGDAIVEPRITRQLIDAYKGRSSTTALLPSKRLTALSPRELDVFTAIAAGLSNTEICAHLHLSSGTVKTYVNRVFAKLELRDRVQAVILAHQLGLAIGTRHHGPS